MSGIARRLSINLIRLAKAHAATAGITIRTVGRSAHGSSYFFERLEAGEVSFTASKYEEMRQWFETNRKPGMRWPKLYEPWMDKSDGKTGKRANRVSTRSRR